MVNIKKALTVLCATAAIVAPGLVLAVPAANANITCWHGLQGSWSGDKAWASCAEFERAVQQVRVTADCIAGPDRNSEWFHDYRTHTTGSCGSYGLTGKARASIISSRY